MTGFRAMVAGFATAIPGAKIAASAVRDPEMQLEAVSSAVMALELADRVEFLEAFEAPWDLLIIISQRHPSLAAVVGWVENMDRVLLLAGAVPRPPEVWCLQPATPS